MSSNCSALTIGHFYMDLLEDGGVPSEVRYLVRALADLGVPSILFCPRGKHEVKYPRVSTVHVPRSLPKLAHRLRTILRKGGVDSKPDLLVLYGAFSPANVIAGLIAHQQGLPYVVSPEGILSPVALGHGHRVRKLIFWKLCDRALLDHAAGLRVLSDFEKATLRQLGIKRPMFVAPEGTPPESLEVRDDLRPTLGASSEARSLLFMGRLDIWQKGLDNLIVGFAESLRVCPQGQTLTLVGPGSRQAIESLRKLAQGESLIEERDFRIRPAVSGDKKWVTLSSADVFVHPSRREGVPRVIREALAVGLPVIVTPQTNLADQVVRHGAGWCIPCTASGVRDGIVSAITTPISELIAKRQASFQLARSELSWSYVASLFARGIQDVLTEA